MLNRYCWVLAVFAAAPLISASPVESRAADPSERSSCKAPGSTEVSQQTARVTVYRRAADPPLYWGCARSRGKTIPLLPPNAEDSKPTLFRITGNRVLFDGVEIGRDIPTERAAFFTVYNLGAKQRAVPKVVRYVGCSAGRCSDKVTDAVLKPNGSAAAIVSRDSDRYVIVADKNGVEQVDASPDIKPESLKLSGGTVSWMRGGESQRRRIR